MRDTTTATVQRLDRAGRWVDLVTGMAPEAADSLVARLSAETGRAYRVDDTDATTGPMADAIRAAEQAIADEEWGDVGDGGRIAGADFRVYWMAGFGDERPYPPIGRRLALRELRHDAATTIVDRLNRCRATGERGEWTIRRIR